MRLDIGFGCTVTVPRHNAGLAHIMPWTEARVSAGGPGFDITVGPTFSVSRLAFLRAYNGVYAIAGIRWVLPHWEWECKHGTPCWSQCISRQDGRHPSVCSRFQPCCFPKPASGHWHEA